MEFIIKLSKAKNQCLQIVWLNVHESFLKYKQKTLNTMYQGCLLGHIGQRSAHMKQHLTLNGLAQRHYKQTEKKQRQHESK